jgi:hypothetical protein
MLSMFLCGKKITLSMFIYDKKPMFTMFLCGKKIMLSMIQYDKKPMLSMFLCGKKIMSFIFICSKNLCYLCFYVVKK